MQKLHIITPAIFGQKILLMLCFLIALVMFNTCEID